MSNLQADIPLVNVPFVDDKGNVSEPWFIFLIQLWRRTGGSSPAGNVLTIGDVLGLEQTFNHAVASKDKIGAFDLTFAPAQTVAKMADVVVSQPQSASKFVDMVTPPIHDIGGPTTTTSPAAGGAGALPATPSGYAIAMIDGVKRLVAFY